MKVLILPDAAAATRRAGDLVLDALRADPKLVLGLATGGTMEPLYRYLAQMRGILSFADVTTFNLDEYVGLPPTHSQSYHSYMQQHLFAHIDIDPAHTHLPFGDAPNPVAEAARYDAAIAAAGGIGLQVLGLGANGHIGFNEPASSLGSRTRVKMLAARTRADNARFFDRPEEVPHFAITMGIATILQARDIILLATGAGKSRAVREMIEGPIAAICPASVLQMHSKATVILDKDAAKELRLLDYFNEVHPDGQDPVMTMGLLPQP
jgi:glucosamine-6-phosphate deaminase